MDRKFNFSEAKARLPKFDENNIDQYMIDFEKLCTAFHFPQDEWCNLLSSVVTGKASKAFSRLTHDELNDYGKYKELILNELQITPEVYKLRFRKAAKRVICRV